MRYALAPCFRHNLTVGVVVGYKLPNAIQCDILDIERHVLNILEGIF